MLFTLFYLIYLKPELVTLIILRPPDNSGTNRVE